MEQFERLKRDELVAEMDRLGLPMESSKMTKTAMLERIQEYLSNTKEVNGAGGNASDSSQTKRRSPRRQAPTRPVDDKSSQDAADKLSPPRRETSSSPGLRVVDVSPVRSHRSPSPKHLPADGLTTSVTQRDTDQQQRQKHSTHSGQTGAGGKKKKRRNNKKNKVIERRPLLESTRPKVLMS